MEEGIWKCKMGNVYVSNKGKLYKLVRKMDNKKIVKG